MKINIEGCVNTLAKECMAFHHNYGKDGRNYTARAVYPCFYDPFDSNFVVVNFDPDHTLVLLIMFVTIPFGECTNNSKAFNLITHITLWFSLQASWSCPVPTCVVALDSSTWPTMVTWGCVAAENTLRELEMSRNGIRHRLEKACWKTAPRTTLTFEKAQSWPPSWLIYMDAYSFTSSLVLNLLHRKPSNVGHIISPAFIFLEYQTASVRKAAKFMTIISVLILVKRKQNR